MHPALRGMRYCGIAIPSGPCGPVQEYPGYEIKKSRTRSILTIQLLPGQKTCIFILGVAIHANVCPRGQGGQRFSSRIERVSGQQGEKCCRPCTSAMTV
jgi:hypothetical protein